MIFKGSRYTHTPTYSRDSVEVFERRNIINFNLEDAQVHKFTQGDTLSILAEEYLGDAQLWWVILDVNNFRSVFDIPLGTNLIIPSQQEVLSIYG